MEPDILQLIEDWQQIKKWQAEAKEKESVLRAAIINRCLGDKFTPAGYLPEGTTKSELQHDSGAKVKVKASVTYERKVLEETLDATLAQLPEELRDMLVKREPKLVTSVYRKLSDENRVLVDTTLQTKPGSPQVEVEVIPAA